MGLAHFEDGKVLFYPYTPSKAAGVIFLFLFAGISLYHIFLIRKFKTKYFIPMVLLGGICDTFGHLGRAWAGSAPLSPKPFMLHLMLILVAPIFISATLYITLGRLKESLLGHPRRKCSPTSIFILTDIVAFCTQIGGSLVQVIANPKIMEIGGHVVLGGLLFQLFMLVVYFALVVRFHRATQREVIDVEHWRRYVWTLVISVVAVWVRNLVRAAEFGQGWYGFVNQHEAMMYIFDSFLMFSVMVAFAVFHPGQLNDSQGSMSKGRQRVTSEQVVMGPFGNLA
ncbi:Protein RTM1 [Colletotrichum viniferum]|nr:Protein RTM1 [Colletotrichum viniferum]